jgi:hypothetical protein
MESEKPIPALIKSWKNKKLNKKQREIEELELDIKKQKLENELNKLKGKG